MLTKNFKNYKLEDKPKEFVYQLTHFMPEYELDKPLSMFVKYNDEGVIVVEKDERFALYTKGNKRT